MVKIVDHQQTGKRKFISGPGRRKDTPLEIFDNKKMGSYSPERLDKETDKWIKKKEVSAALSVAKKSKYSHKPKWQKKKIKDFRISLTKIKKGYPYINEFSARDRIQIHEFIEFIEDKLIKSNG